MRMQFSNFVNHASVRSWAFSDEIQNGAGNDKFSLHSQYWSAAFVFVFSFVFVFLFSFVFLCFYLLLCLCMAYRIARLTLKRQEAVKYLACPVSNSRR